MEWASAARCSFLSSFATQKAMPRETNAVEVCAVGRSNVGKSSFLNALMGRTQLARVSKTPGRTQLINVFLAPSLPPLLPLWIVDLPGYGYARVSKSDRYKLGMLLEDYLSQRNVLQRVCFLIDANHPPQPLDYAMRDFLEEIPIGYRCILTKSDRLCASLLNDRIAFLTEVFLKGSCVALTPPFPVSAKKRTGLQDVRADLLTLCCPQMESPHD